MRKALFNLLAGLALLLGTVGLAMAAEGAAAAKDPWVYLASAAAVSLPGLATGWAQSRIGAAGAGALAENRELFVPVMILVALPETTVILGFVVSIMILIM